MSPRMEVPFTNLRFSLLLILALHRPEDPTGPGVTVPFLS